MAIASNLEIRKLPPSHISQLSSILEFADQWKKLMAIIPSKLNKDNYECNVSCENPPKYNTDHIRLIETASYKYKRPGTEILLDEWGCSGRIRPAVGHLLYLLIKAELFRAADYVAVKILHMNPPQRPSEGPAAPVNINLNGHIIGEILDNIEYNSSLIENIPFSSPDTNFDYSEKRASIPQIIVTPDADKVSTSPDFTLQNTNDNNETNNVSSMIKFSTSIISTSSLPNLSTFSDTESDSQSVVSSVQTIPNSGSNSVDNLSNGYDIPNVPNLSMLNQGDSTSTLNSNTDEYIPNISNLNQVSSQIQDGNIPNISDLNQVSSQIQDIPNISDLNQVSSQIEDANIPNISSLNQKVSSTIQIPNISNLDQSTTMNSDVIPNFGVLMTDKKTKIESTNNTDENLDLPKLNVLIPDSRRSSLNVSSICSKSRQCTSPLPNLTLKTNLPHFAYEEIEIATNNFNEDLYENPENSGRFLGAGAFGKVFLATNLLDRPVAVKKIILENVEVVNVDDAVTKQFKNEVEVLSKFKHENLLSILGYSCDGCTYCLLYEYISGGTLKDRLQNLEKKLQWKERLPVALGTANAISYLHTAFSSPLIHRDIKTANILLDSTNNPKLGDFGITKLLNNPNTNTCTVIGTSAYMAPEALRGDISVKCDTFSFGVVLLELLTSLPTFDENRDGNDLVTHVEEKCDESIQPLLDLTIGSWIENGNNFAEKIYSVAVQCLEEKKRRPVMVEVTKMLKEILDKL